MDRTTFPLSDEATPLHIPHRRWKDHPRPGTDFPDLSPGMADSRVTRRVVEALAERLPADIELLAGIDIGGLGLAGALAYRNGLGFADIRKVESIRADVIRSVMANYELGAGVVLSKGNNLAGRRIAILDDVLMSGGTAAAAVQLVRRLGATCVTALFVVDLIGMGGRERLEKDGVRVHVLQSLPKSGPDALD